MKQKQVVGVLAVTAAALVCVITACGGGAGGSELPPPAYSGSFDNATVRVELDEGASAIRSAVGAEGLLSGRFSDANGTYEAMGIYDDEAGFFILSSSGSASRRYAVYGSMKDGKVISSTAVTLDRTADYEADAFTVKETIRSIANLGSGLSGTFLPRKLWGVWNSSGNGEETILISPLAGYYWQFSSEDYSLESSYLYTIAEVIEKGTNEWDVIISSPDIRPEVVQVEEAFKAIAVLSGLPEPTSIPWTNNRDDLGNNQFMVSPGEDFHNIQHNVFSGPYPTSMLDNYLRDKLDPPMGTKYRKNNFKLEDGQLKICAYAEGGEWLFDSFLEAKNLTNMSQDFGKDFAKLR